MDVVPDEFASDDGELRHDDQTPIAGPPETPSAAEVREMALAALEAVWFDLWTSHGRPFRGQEVVVSVHLPDGTLLGDASK